LNRKLLVPVLTLVLALLACGLPSTPTITPTLTLVPVTDTPPAPALTLDMLRNGTYYAPFYQKTVTLTSGAYTEGSGADTYSVNMLDVYAMGDLNGDGLDDAAVLLVENGGGSGQFESLVVVLNVGGSPKQAGQAELGDRVLVNAVTIASAAVTLDMVVQGPNDPLCCPSVPEKQVYRLVGNALWLTRLTSQAPGGAERAVTVESPVYGATVTNPFTVSGSVTIAPFENTLAVRIYLPDGTKVNESPLTVTATQPGAPGTFSRDFDLSNAGITGTVIIQFLDLSAADGTTLDMDSTVLEVH
jgi:hypothetical protein